MYYSAFVYNQYWNQIKTQSDPGFKFLWEKEVKTELKSHKRSIVVCSI